MARLSRVKSPTTVSARNALAIAQAIMDEIHAPPLVRRGRHAGRRPRHADALAAAAAHGQARLAIEALDELPVHAPALTPQQPVEPPVAHRAF
jgi:hypothetical protein